MKEIVYVEVVVWCVLILVTENVSVYYYIAQDLDGGNLA